MRSTFKMKAVLLAATALGFAAPALAQQAAAEEETKDDADIVVTGTLIRGTEVTGSQTLSVTTDAIIQRGAVSTNEMLGLIPQISNTFNGRFEGDPRGGKAITVNRPNLRNLPNLTSASGAATLVLIDGKRVNTVGVKEAAVDPDIVPAMALEGVDVVTDGGSSLYGADAVSGVINFRTRRKYEGLKVDANYGFGTTIKGFDQYDASILAGHSWDSGNIWVTGTYSNRDFIRNNETTWASGIRYTAAGVATNVGTQCLAPVGTETRWKHYATGSSALWTQNPGATGAGVFPVGTPCDTVSSDTYSPKQNRYSVYGAITQEVSDTIDLRITGYWTKRKTQLFGYPLGHTAAGNPLAASTATGAQIGAIYGDPALNTIIAIPGGIGYSFGANSAYVDRPNVNGFETWGVTPEITAKLSGDWQVRASLHYGRSTNYQRWNEVNGVLAQCYITGCTAATSPTGAAITAGQLDPQNVGAASATVVTAILNYETAVDTRQEMFDFRAVADGSLFELPGGMAKMAVGVEYNRPNANVRLGTAARGAINSVAYLNSNRNSKSVFGEVSLPITSFATVAGSLRFDDYSDFGSTTNPSIGLTVNPMEGLKVFGHWNTSFNAPTTLDRLPLGLGRQGGIIYCNTSASCPRPTDPLGKWTGIGTKSLVLEGPGFGIGPQTAESWAVGFEAKPVDGIRFGGEFYSINFKNIIGGVDVTSTQSYIDFPQYFTYSSDPQFSAKYDALVASLGNAAFVTANIAKADVAVIVDRRTTNLNNAKLRGLDFHFYYDKDTSLGHFTFGIAGNQQSKAQLITGAVVTDQLALNGPRSTITSFLALSNEDGINARFTVNRSGAFRDGNLDYLGNRVYVNAFSTANLFLGYNVGKDHGALSGTSLRFTVDNLFDKKPQIVQRPTTTSGVTYNNWTLGRVIKVGFSKEF